MYVLDAAALKDLGKLGLSGKRDALLAALEAEGALIRSGKNRAHNKLPAEVKFGDDLGREVPNYRLNRAELKV